MEGRPVAPRFLTLTDVAETLNVSLAQVKALVRGGDLPAIKIGGRGAWRVESSQLEAYIARMYDLTREFIAGGATSGATTQDGDGRGESVLEPQEGMQSAENAGSAEGYGAPEGTGSAQGAAPQGAAPQDGVAGPREA